MLFFQCKFPKTEFFPLLEFFFETIFLFVLFAHVANPLDLVTLSGTVGNSRFKPFA